MQAYLLLAPICIESGLGGSSILTENLFSSPRLCSRQWNRRSRTDRSGAVVASAATNNQQDHYAVLGLSSAASSADIKKAYRLLARKDLRRGSWDRREGVSTEREENREGEREDCRDERDREDERNREKESGRERGRETTSGEACPVAGESRDERWK
ncbi:hypothetical protein Sjap_013000 [Stephania japonica]|uniref:J domain-containing protein n=1 Tax=Stephania japonica TaxID=461633 RepID=A0AAP0NY73_9MAGN